MKTNRKPAPSFTRSPKKPAQAIPPAGSLAGPTLSVRLAVDRERQSRYFHPWVFSGAVLDTIAAVPPFPVDILPGIVRVLDAWGGFVAWAQYHLESKICLRLVEWVIDTVPDQKWLRARLAQAFARRAGMHGGSTGTDTLRIVFSEADLLPGLVIDRMGEVLVVQSESAIMDSWLAMIADLLPDVALAWIPNLSAIIERSDGDGRAMDGLPVRYATLWGVPPENTLTIHENAIPFSVRFQGQKTGFYTDQRDNRHIVARYAAGKKVLDVCCYTGGFSAYAMVAGAESITLLDASADALSLARENLANLPTMRDTECPIESYQGDAFQALRRLRDDGRAGSWDLIILDPPKLAPNRASIERALAGYKDLNLQAIKLLAPGGYLASFSCSGLVSADDLRQAISFAAKDAGRQVHILHHLYQAPCHPVLLGFPEGEYLKGFLLRIV